MRELIAQSARDSVKAAEKLLNEDALSFMESVARLLAETLKHGGKLLVCGNGGSNCDAAHFAEELSGYYREKRRALAAICLSEPGFLTCVGNDLGFDHVCARGGEALGNENDLLVVLTTSGNSKNIVLAVEEAKRKKLKTVSFLGKDGGKLKGLCDLEWIVSGFRWSDRVQEAHMAAIHIIIEQMERLLFPEKILHEALSTSF
jgi:D-sedoheptulose 7-phosphate isomerase